MDQEQVALLRLISEQDFPYGQEGPQGLLESCDIVLRLDDGSKLPVHSPILARCSPVFNRMLYEGTLSRSKAGIMVTVPFSDCSREEATSFLSVLYSLKPHQRIDKASAFSIARLGDKYGAKVNTRCF